MSRAHQRYLVLEQGVGAAVVNFGINAALAWALFRGHDVVPLWGRESIMVDTIATSVILPLVTCLIVTPVTRRHVQGGRFGPLGWSRTSHPMLARLPRATVLRGLVLGAIGLVLLVPPTWLALVAFGIRELELGDFILFKAGFAALEAALVTPIIARWALGEAPLS